MNQLHCKRLHNGWKSSDANWYSCSCCLYFRSNTYSSSSSSKMIAFVTPKSKKASNRFCNLMERNSECIVEQHLGNKVFLTSANGRNHFWVNLSQDNDWNIAFWNKYWATQSVLIVWAQPLKPKWHSLTHLSHLVIISNLKLVPFGKKIPTIMFTLMLSKRMENGPMKSIIKIRNLWLLKYSLSELTNKHWAT